MNSLLTMFQRLIKFSYGVPATQNHKIYGLFARNNGEWALKAAHENLDDAKSEFAFGDVIITLVPSARTEMAFTTSELK